MTKKYCTPYIWEKYVRAAANAAGVDAALVLAGERDRKHTAVRWSVWRDLRARGFSFYSLGKASGYDHTSVMSACASDEPPFRNSAVTLRKIPAIGCTYAAKT
jgi:hypothetical protein